MGLFFSLVPNTYYSSLYEATMRPLSKRALEILDIFTIYTRNWQKKKRLFIRNSRNLQLENWYSNPHAKLQLCYPYDTPNFDAYWSKDTLQV